MTALVAYIRVSTSKQGKSGLGLEAQQEAIERFAEAHGLEIFTKQFVEVETGKGADALSKRPVLKSALDAARRLKARIAVAKLDRLGRDVAFISGLMAERVPFVVTELGPDIDPFMLHIYAAVAEKEAKMIGERTKAALKVRKAQGKKLGNPRAAQAALAGGASTAAKADEFAMLTYVHIEGMQQRGIKTLRAIAAELDRLRVPSATGKAWSAMAVSNIIHRANFLRELRSAAE
jgi:DNA invertase Pin-like site-specific DNA recombinase